MQPPIHSAIRLPDSPTVSRYVPALTGLRAVAAYLVFLHHHNPALPGTFAHRLFSQGYIGVSIFFVLSGFLIEHHYADAYLEKTNWSWRRYLHHRLARIYPLYALLLLITVGGQALMGRPMSLGLFSLNLTLLKGFFEDYKFSGIPQSWSLTVELCFYGLAPLLFRHLRRWGVLRLTICLTCTGLLGWATVGQLAWSGFLGSVPFVLFYLFFGRAFEFVVGMWLARRWHQNQLPAHRFPLFGGLLFVSVCVVWQASVPLFITNPDRLLWSEVMVYSYALPVGIGLLFWGLLRQKTSVGRLLSMPLAQLLGRSSYAFYLIHTGILANGLQQFGITSVWILFGMLVLIAHGLYVFIEKPLHRHLRAYKS